MEMMIYDNNCDKCLEKRKRNKSIFYRYPIDGKESLRQDFCTTHFIEFIWGKSKLVERPYKLPIKRPKE